MMLEQMRIASQRVHVGWAKREGRQVHALTFVDPSCVLVEVGEFTNNVGV